MKKTIDKRITDLLEALVDPWAGSAPGNSDVVEVLTLIQKWLRILDGAEMMRALSAGMLARARFEPAALTDADHGILDALILAEMESKEQSNIYTGALIDGVLRRAKETPSDLSAPEQALAVALEELSGFKIIGSKVEKGDRNDEEE